MAYVSDCSKVMVLVLLFCVALWFLLRGISLIFFLVLFSIVITLLGEDGWSICFLCICFFILNVLLFFFFFSIPLPLSIGVGDCDCGTPWTYHLTFCKYLNHQIEFVFHIWFNCVLKSHCWYNNHIIKKNSNILFYIWSKLTLYIVSIRISFTSSLTEEPINLCIITAHLSSVRISQFEWIKKYLY